MTTAERFRKARTEAGLTQKAAADMLGTLQSNVAAIESGTRVPKLDWVYDAAVKLGIDPHALDPRLASTKRRR